MAYEARVEGGNLASRTIRTMRACVVRLRGQLRRQAEMCSAAGNVGLRKGPEGP